MRANLHVPEGMHLAALTRQRPGSGRHRQRCWQTRHVQAGSRCDVWLQHRTSQGALTPDTSDRHQSNHRDGPFTYDRINSNDEEARPRV